MREPEPGTRYVTGTRACPPVISENLWAWLAICSNTRNSSDGIWNSITGRDPAIAAPVAKLVKRLLRQRHVDDPVAGRSAPAARR